jgi:hypothetical protein
VRRSPIPEADGVLLVPEARVKAKDLAACSMAVTRLEAQAIGPAGQELAEICRRLIAEVGQFSGAGVPTNNPNALDRARALNRVLFRENERLVRSNYDLLEATEWYRKRQEKPPTLQRRA